MTIRLVRAPPNKAFWLSLPFNGTPINALAAFADVDSTPVLLELALRSSHSCCRWLSRISYHNNSIGMHYYCQLMTSSLKYQLAEMSVISHTLGNNPKCQHEVPTFLQHYFLLFWSIIPQLLPARLVPFPELLMHISRV